MVPSKAAGKNYLSLMFTFIGKENKYTFAVYEVDMPWKKMFA